MSDRSDELREWYAEDESEPAKSRLETCPDQPKQLELPLIMPQSDDPLAEMFNGAWLDAQVFPPLEYAVGGIVPEGFGLLVAPPKAGKSWLVCGIGLACAVGGLALARIRVSARPVLYLALEDGKRRLQSRSRRIMCGEPLPAGIHFVTRARPVDVIPMITEFLQRYGDDKPLIILDTLGKARPPRPPGSDLYAWDYAIGTQLKDVIDTTPGASLLVVHHTRKTESADFVDSVSGSQGIAGSADFVLVLSRKRHSDDALLSVTGRDIAEGEYALTVTDGLWQLDGGSLHEAAAAAMKRRDAGDLGDKSLEAMEFVNSRPLDTRPADLATHLGIDGNVAGNYLRRLCESGRIGRRARGLYTPLIEAVEVVESGAENITSITSINPGLDTDATQLELPLDYPVHCRYCGGAIPADRPLARANGYCSRGPCIAKAFDDRAQQTDD